MKCLKNKFVAMTLASAVTMPFFGEALEVDGQLNEQEWQSAISLALDKTVSPFTLHLLILHLR